MKMISTTVLGLALLSGLTPALAQPYGARDYGYDRRDYDGRDRDYDDRDRGGYRRDYDRRGRGGFAFDEGEYLRCNPDVRRAVMRGQMPSGLTHYQSMDAAKGAVSAADFAASARRSVDTVGQALGFRPDVLGQPHSYSDDRARSLTALPSA